MKQKPLTYKQRYYQYCKTHPLQPCEITGATEHVNRHHILDRRFYPELIDDERNIIHLSPSKHKYGRLSAHRNAIWFAEWLRLHQPERYAWILEQIARKESEKKEEGAKRGNRE